ncbi:YhhN-like protein [delta proteobacterium NaphS2]|nr:YhhN-like protein [delta proteobacterium NaphS2]
MTAITVVLACILMPVLLCVESKEIPKKILPVKTAISLLFVLTALIQPRPVPAYFLWLLPGLICCLGGDVFLALPQKKMFFFGLISFLAGHLFYIICFYYTSPPSGLVLLVALPVAVAGSWIFLRLTRHLGDMMIPVFIYIIVITIMICGAFSILLKPELALPGRLLALSGALSFYVSDLFVARDRFVKKGPVNRILGLPLYFGGQFLLAFSIGYL